MTVGKDMMEWAEELFPYNRSLTGEGVRRTLDFIKAKLPDLQVVEVPTGTRAFDWTVPQEWEISEGWIADMNGNKLIDFKNNNLHVMGYSAPIDKIVSKIELENHLYSLPEQPNAIPYITSYYHRKYGFCLSQIQRETLGEGPFHVFINSRHFDGHLTFAELLIKGTTDEEVIFSTYVCHPSMANNEISGPVVTIALAKHLLALKDRRFTYRILFSIENIGTIYYLSKNYKELKANFKAGWVITCVGDNLTHSFLPSKHGHSLSDLISRKVLSDMTKQFIEYEWLESGSDERRYNAPGIDLPVSSIMRSMYGKYPEYHTSLDNLDFISAEGLEGSLRIYEQVIRILETNKIWKVKTICEPNLGSRGMYPEISTKQSSHVVKNMMNILSSLDGKATVLEISNACKINYEETLSTINKLFDVNLVELHNG